MRIVSGGIQHETNTFSHQPTALADFERDSGCGPDFSGGDAIFRRYRNTGTIHGGYIDAADVLGFELCPLICARAQPSGIVEASAFNAILEMFLDRLKEALDVDGVLLDLHGAMVTADCDDGEAPFMEAVRAAVGPEIPIIATLDLHANITRRMAEACDVIIGFDTYPHVDMRERGREAGELLVRMIRGEVRAVQAYRQLPLLTMPPMQCTLREPMRSLMDWVFGMESEPGLLTATVAMGFPFADILDAGVSCLVTADGDAALANDKADELAGRLWALRDDLQPQLTPIDEIIQFSATHEGPILYADGSDNPGGGAPCDGTVVLRALIEADFQNAVVGVIFDPETAAQAHAAGVGATINARIGGKTDDRHGSPVESPAYVRALCDGHFVHRGPMNRGVVGEFGPMALLVIGGVEVVIGSHGKQLLDREMLRVIGVAPEHRRLIVVKSAVHFRADFGECAAHIFDADTPGIHRPDFSNYEYHKLRRPIYPLDDVTVEFGG